MVEVAGTVFQRVWIELIVSEILLTDVGRFRSWVDLPFVSDHAPVVVQFDFQPFPMAYPFKLNPSWLNEVDFAPIVCEVWWDPGFLVETDVQIRFVWKLKVLKSRIKSWVWIRRSEQQKRLSSLEEEIRATLSNLPRSGLYPINACRLKSLESERNRLLLIEEEHWRQRSRAVWLKSGDRNTKYFHKVANVKRNHKHLWEIWDELGQEHRGQEALKSEANNISRTYLLRIPISHLWIN
jgi:hypothetical protein